jgi:PKHD-type hydroxylase
MNLQYSYWYFTSVLSDKFCDEVIKYGKSQQEEIALTGNEIKKIKDSKTLNEEDIKILNTKRNSNIVWMNEPWIYNEILPYVHTANKSANWNFEINWTENCQFTKYNIGQFYDWHQDSWEKPYDIPNENNKNGKIRKLSVTCSLSDPKDYEGGNLEFDCRKEEPGQKNNIITCDQIKPRGSIIVFPSHLWHRVQPVTKGIRYSLVMWNLGYPFK